MIRLVLTDDHAVLRDALRKSLEAAGFDIVGEAADGIEAVTVCERELPDLVVMDVGLPLLDGIAAARKLRLSVPSVRVVILTMFDDPATIDEAAAVGVYGYLAKDCTTASLVEALHEAAAPGALPIPRPVLASSGRSDLSRREIEVLQLLSDGASTAEIAEALFVSAKTVKNHLTSIYEKMEARDRTQAVVMGLRQGLVRLARGPRQAVAR